MKTFAFFKCAKKHVTKLKVIPPGIRSVMCMTCLAEMPREDVLNKKPVPRAFRCEEEPA